MTTHQFLNPNIVVTPLVAWILIGTIPIIIGTNRKQHSRSIWILELKLLLHNHLQQICLLVVRTTSGCVRTKIRSRTHVNYIDWLIKHAKHTNKSFLLTLGFYFISWVGFYHRSIKRLVNILVENWMLYRLRNFLVKLYMFELNLRT